jgi:hypothetical protein
MARATHFSPRRRTAVVLSGEGTGAAYLVGALRALDAAGVRIDVVLGRGAGALVAAFAGLSGEDRIDGKGGLLDALAETPPYRVAPLYRFAALCLAASFALFAAPALLGLVSVVVLPLQALARGFFPDAALASPLWLSRVVEAVEPFYLPLVALPLIVLFLAFSARALRFLWRERGRRPPFAELFPPPLDLRPLERALATRLWQLAKGTSPDERPRDRRALSEAYVKLLTSGLGQPGFREIVLYALDTDTGEEVPFVALKERFAKKMASEPGVGRTEAIDLSGEGAGVLFDALIAAATPPGLAAEVGIRLPRGTKLGGEVHRFVSSLSTGGGVMEDAVAAGAEQIVYVTSAAAGARAEGNLWERMAIGGLRTSIDRDRLSDSPLWIVRPEAERLSPYELEGRPQLGGGRLALSALVDQGARDLERLFIRPVLGEDLAPLPAEPPVSVDRSWESGPKEL